MPSRSFFGAAARVIFGAALCAWLGFGSTLARAQDVLSFFNVDDQMNGSLNGTPILQVNFNQTGSVNFTGLVRPGLNSLTITDFNFLGGWSFGYTVTVNGALISSGSCGTVNVLGCNNNAQFPTNQVVFSTDVVFCTCNVQQTIQSMQTQSDASTQQNQQLGNQQQQLTNFLTQGGGPGAGGSGDQGGGPQGGPGPGGGADQGSGVFNPQAYPGGYSTLSDPSGALVSQYAPKDRQPAVFKAMPPAGVPFAAVAAPQWSGFVLGTFGGTAGDNNASGSIGLQRTDATGVTVGATVGGVIDTAQTQLTGSIKTDSGLLSAFASRVPDTGLQWLMIGSANYASLDITRGYFNGATSATSTGGTHSSGFGALGQVGWGFAAGAGWLVSPYFSYALAYTRLFGYSEANGPQPAQFNTINQTVNTTRLGVNDRYTFAPGRWLFGGLDWAHQFEGTAPQVTGTLTGLFPLLSPGSPVDQNWLEATGGVHWALTKDTWATGSLTASAFSHAAARWLASASVTKNF